MPTGRQDKDLESRRDCLDEAARPLLSNVAVVAFKATLAAMARQKPKRDPAEAAAASDETREHIRSSNEAIASSRARLAKPVRS